MLSAISSQLKNVLSNNCLKAFFWGNSNKDKSIWKIFHWFEIISGPTHFDSLVSCECIPFFNNQSSEPHVFHFDTAVAFYSSSPLPWSLSIYLLHYCYNDFYKFQFFSFHWLNQPKIPHQLWDDFQPLTSISLFELITHLLKFRSSILCRVLYFSLLMLSHDPTGHHYPLRPTWEHVAFLHCSRKLWFYPNGMYALWNAEHLLDFLV